MERSWHNGFSTQKIIFKDPTLDADCNYFKWADGASSSKGVKRKAQLKTTMKSKKATMSKKAKKIISSDEEEEITEQT